MELSILLKIIFQAIGGLGIFLLGMRYLSDGIQSVASAQLRRLVGAVTNNRFVALGVGVVFTCLVQSSSITTVMVVGLVNSTVMTLGQAIGVIMGANIGTTITGWILVIKIGKYGLPMLGAGALVYLFSRNERAKFIAMIIMGVGMVFFGLELMKNGFKPIRSMPEFVEWFSFFEATSYFGVLKAAMVGCLLTFIVQSSSATLAITMGLATTGVINFETGAALVLGENIGTTITAFIASFGSSTNAKRAAYAHIIFNVLGVIWITSIFFFYLTWVKSFLGVDPGMMTMENGNETFPYIILGIATVHTGFNVANTILFIPFVRVMEKFLIRFIPDMAVVEKARLTKLDDVLIETPMVAIETTRAEIQRMGEIVDKMMGQLKEAIGGESVNKEFVNKVFHREEALDKIQNEISIFLTGLLVAGLPHEVTDEGRQQIHMADEYESISDYIVRILKLHLRLREANLTLPSDDLENIFKLHDDVTAYTKMVTNGCANRTTEILFKANPQSDAINHEVRRIRKHHLAKLSGERKDPLITMIYSDMLNGYRRIKDHALNIAEALSGEK
ncbi:Sodium-dependent phosphate transporter [hydrothermal vent metagenome]|uniref:Sodium-dependent phosphate transporter n=1 Tax=hydrothermal vent metagenome TaxID=652676 RepID=A0A3B1BNU6_9ZZZZ